VPYITTRIAEVNARLTVAILYEDEDQLELPETTKAIFYAEAELGV
jgi:hypothetical protein